MTAWRHIFFIADLEGVAGVDSWDQTRGSGPRHEYAKALATEEVNSVVAAILGPRDRPNRAAPRISVWDGHGYGGLLLEHLDERVSAYPHDRDRGYPELLRSLRSGALPVDAVGFIGQHAMEGSEGTLCHTYSSRRVSRYSLNGRRVGEIAVRVLFAWALARIPTVFLSGDDVACDEAESVVPGILKVPVKSSLGITSARHLEHAESCARLAAEARRILQCDPADPSLRPALVPEPPYEFRKDFKRKFALVPRFPRILRGDDLAEILSHE